MCVCVCVCVFVFVLEFQALSVETVRFWASTGTDVFVVDHFVFVVVDFSGKKKKSSL